MTCFSLNAPTGAWCSLTTNDINHEIVSLRSQCTYRCVVLPDADQFEMITTFKVGLNAPTGAWCSLTTIEIQDYRKESKVSMHLQVRGAP